MKKQEKPAFNKYIGCKFVESGEANLKDLIPCDLGQENQPIDELPGDWRYDGNLIAKIKATSWDGSAIVLVFVPKNRDIEVQKEVFDFLLGELDDHDAYAEATVLFQTQIAEDFGDCQGPLDVHHIDYNNENCGEDNLITLCRQCHAQM